MKSAVIDLDSLGWIVAYQQFVQMENKTDKEKVKNHIKDFVSSILATVEAEEYLMVYQAASHRNFRKTIFDGYKATRPPAPEFYVHWKETVHETFAELEAIPLHVIESDDVLSIISKTYRSSTRQIILCHNDKDMFQLPGLHYLFVKNEFKPVTVEEARRNLLLQILTGDSTDNIAGCKGIGPKKAEKILDSEGLLIPTYKKIYGEMWRKEFSTTVKLITLLNPNQKYEEINIVWKKNDKLTTVSSLFESSDEELLG